MTALQRSCLLALLLVLPLFASPASAAPSVEGISARPVDAAGKPIGQAYFVEERNAGSKFVGHLSISNSGKRFARLYVYAVDAVTSTRGGTVFAPRDQPDKAVGKWITPNKTLIRLDPGDTKVVSFTVDIPADAFPGDHVGGVAIEPLRREKTGGQFSVTQVLRVAIATQIKIRGATQQAFKPTILHLKAIAGSQVPALTVRLANDGDLLCKPQLTATLSQGGQPLSTENRDVDTILARTSIDYPLLWPRGLKAGTYTAVVRTQGCGKSAEVQSEVTLKSDLSGKTKPATTGVVSAPSEEGVPTWVFVVGGVLAAIALLTLGWWLARLSARRERDRERQRDREDDDRERERRRRERDRETDDRER